MFVDIKCRTLKIQFTDYLYPKENSVSNFPSVKPSLTKYVLLV